MRTRTLGLVILAVSTCNAAIVAACGDDSETPASRDGGTDASATTTDGSVGVDGTAGNTDSGNSMQDAGFPEDASTDAFDAGQVDRGPSKYLMPNVPNQASPNGLFWQYGADPALYVADEGNNTIMRWDDKKGFTKATGLPDELAPDSGGLGQVIRLEDGTFFVTRFGFGTGGGIIYVAATGDAGYITGLDVTRKRIGLGLNPDGTLTTTYFKGNGAATTGSVAKLATFTGGEKDFITNLSKPVGVSFLENRIVATDQNLNYVVQSTALTIGGQFQDPQDGGPDAGGYDAGSVADSGLPDVFAILTGGDAICQGPDGSIFAATNTGTVYKIARDGTVSAVPGATGLVRTKGVAYDGANKRLFVAEIDTTNGSSVHIYPIN